MSPRRGFRAQSPLARPNRAPGTRTEEAPRTGPATARGGPHGPPPGYSSWSAPGPPVVALRVRRGLAAALGGTRARARADAGRRALRDRECVTGLRRREDGEAGAGARRCDRHLALARADVEAGVAELRGRRAVRVVAG